MHISDIPTPFLLVDPAVVDRNARRLADYAARHRLAVRPHIKTHKSRRVWEIQKRMGAIGITSAKPSEAEQFLDLTDDILLAYPIVTADKADHLVEMASRGKTVRVACDSEACAQTLAAAARKKGVTFGLLVDLDIGHHRTGVLNTQEAVQLARTISEMPGVRFDGLFCYPGQIRGREVEQAAEIAATTNLVAHCLTELEKSGLHAEIVSGGSTPTAWQSHLNPHLTEIRPGTSIYNDANCLLQGYCELEDCAARLVVTVVSVSVPGQIVVDAGSKSLTSDRNAVAQETGFGVVVGYPEASVRWLNEEHGVIDIRNCQSVPQLGQRLEMIPNHICPCVNLHQQFWWKLEDGTALPVPVDARGMVW